MAIHELRPEPSASKRVEKLSGSHVQIVENLDPEEVNRSQCNVSS